MSIKRQKATAIMQGLFADLAATGSFKALAIVKKAWTIQSAEQNTQDALDYLKSAEQKARSCLARIERPKGTSPISQTLKPSITTMLNSTVLVISRIEQSGALLGSASAYWSTTGRDLLLDISSRLQKLITSVSDQDTELKAELKAELNVPLTEPLATVDKRYICSYLIHFRESLEDALDQIKNAIEASKDLPRLLPAADPATAPALEPNDAYMTYIFGAHKLLDKFLEEYASGDLTSEEDKIIKLLIMDNEYSRKLMSAYLKKDIESKLVKMFKDPDFSNKAKVLFDKIKANIAAATAELDKLGSL